MAEELESGMAEEVESNEYSLQHIDNPESIETYKSLYYWLNAKPDTHIKIFPKSRLLAFNSIVTLNEKIQKKLENHHLFTNITSITISFDNKEIQSFSAWEVFKSTSWDMPEKTESVSINWDITLKLPNYKLPQKHTLKIRIGSSLRPNELFQIMTSGDDEVELKENLSFIVCKVDFINVIISKELLRIVDEWYNTLPELELKSKIPNFLEHRRPLIANIGHYLTTFIGLTIFYNVFKLHVRNITDFGFTKEFYLDAFLWAIGLFGTYFLFNIIGNESGRKIYSIINKYEDSHYFSITTGDRNEQLKIERKNKSVSTNLFWQFIIRTAVALISLAVSKFILHTSSH